MIEREESRICGEIVIYGKAENGMAFVEIEKQCSTAIQSPVEGTMTYRSAYELYGIWKWRMRNEGILGPVFQ